MEVTRILSFVTLFIVFCDQLCAQIIQTDREDNKFVEFHVGVVLDMSSWEGKIVNSCISMAVSDFYNIHDHYRTRLVLHTKDSRGEPLRALSAAVDLLENIGVGAIVGAQTSTEAKFLAELGHKARVPVISFPATSHSQSFAKYPYFVRITHNRTSEARGIAAIIESFKWKNVVLMYEEETDFDRDMIPCLVSSLQEKNIHIAYSTSGIDASLIDDERIIEELHKLVELQTKVFIVHMSCFLASRVFFNAEKLGMMSEGYGWIVTTKCMSLFDIESVQGVIGFKPYIPESKELNSVASRWRKAVDSDTYEELSPFGVWAYDAMWVLAKAAETSGPRAKQPDNTRFNFSNLDSKTGTSSHGSTLLKEMARRAFKGLSGELRLTNGEVIFETFEITNVIGKRNRRVGFWTSEGKIRKQLMDRSTERRFLSSTNDLEAIIWPGGSVSIPRGSMSGKKLRIAVPVRSGFPELLKVDYDAHTNATTATGFCVDAFKAAKESLPYEVNYEFIASTLRYHELIDEVYHKNFDAIVGDLTVTANRSFYVDFTLPYTDFGVGLLAPKYDRNIWIFLKPLTADLWLSTAAFFVITGFIVWMIEHPINDEFQGSLSQQIGTSFWFSFSTLVFAHRQKLLSNLSRFVVSVWVFVVLLLTSSYTATLTSMLTVQQINLNSRRIYAGFQEVGAVNNMNIWSSRSSPQAYANALNKNGGTSAIAIMDEIPYLRIFTSKYSVDYSIIDQRSMTNGFAFVFTKGSPLVPDLSRAIAKLREEGQLKKLEELWFQDNDISSTIASSSQDNFVALNFDRFRGLFLITGVSSTLAFVMFFTSLLHQKWCHVVRNCKLFAHIVGKQIGRILFRSPS